MENDAISRFQVSVNTDSFQYTSCQLAPIAHADGEVARLAYYIGLLRLEARAPRSDAFQYDA